MNSKCECRTKFWIYTLTALGTLLIVAVLVKVMVDYTRPAALGEDRAALRHKNLKELRDANTEVLNNANFVWQDQPKGIVRMPINNAMDLALKLWQDPVAARANLLAREKVASAVPPKAPEKPSQFE